MWFFFFQAEDGIRDAQESRGLGDVYKRQIISLARRQRDGFHSAQTNVCGPVAQAVDCELHTGCLLYTSDAADDLLCVDLGGRRIIKKKNNIYLLHLPHTPHTHSTI